MELLMILLKIWFVFIPAGLIVWIIVLAIYNIANPPKPYDY